MENTSVHRVAPRPNALESCEVTGSFAARTESVTTIAGARNTVPVMENTSALLVAHNALECTD